MAKDKILITGGTGYIGSHTVVELFNAGYEPIIIDNLSNSNIGVLDGIKAITGHTVIYENIDCKDYNSLERFLEKHPEIVAIAHFAASKSVSESVENPLLYYRNNIVSLLNLLQLMPKFNIKNIVFSSSCTVYGQPDKLPVTEESPIKPATSPYGSTKQMCETILQDYAFANKDINVILLRYFNPIGAHPSGEIGELPNGVPNNLLPYITQTAAGIRKELSVFGNDYNTPDGSCIRDYINVVDLAKAHVVALNRVIEGNNKKNIEIFNLGTGSGLSVLEIVTAFEKATGVKLPYKIVGRRPGDIEKVWADTSYANKELGWKATETLEDTLRSAWNWQQKLVEKNLATTNG
ncbi:MAG: UDP-glucose 4-epimerase GalE [Paludibacteraceae bacterium]|nr:UDP-glucose 4-epimerase GalE [Paludibacteraceae bacterium]